ncbi:MAG: hypothetical protein IPK64_09260 [bacterium]|nr:hypothetical protein [bacterium]
MPLSLLAAIEPGSLDPAALGGGGSWWRMIGGLAVVFGLLFLCLKLLTRFGSPRGGVPQARILSVWHLGPRREVQVLRLGEQVSYVYRHDNAMVLLRQEQWDEYRRQHAETATGEASAPGLPAALLRHLGPLRARLPRAGA